MNKFIITITLLMVNVLEAQISGRNLMELQNGKLPDVDNKDFSSVYNKLQLNYRYNKLKATGVIQAYQTPFSTRNYYDLSWIGINYKNKVLDLSVGNFYKTLGRGLLLRSYEIQGGLLEDKGYRSKQYFYRDILGATATWKHQDFRLTGVWGYTLNNVYPPTQPFKTRRSDEVAAINAQYKVLKQKIEISALRVTNEFEKVDYGSINLSGRILPNLTYFTAFAKILNRPINDKKNHAFYSNLNFSKNKIGFSLEWKDYKNFLIGSGINEPPALIREHSYLILNRSTHVLLPNDEKGMQFEGFYQLDASNLITLNYSRAINLLSKKLEYTEWFAEWSTSMFKKTDLKVFFDFANDPLKNETNRFSSGFLLTHELQNRKGLNLEFNNQSFDRSGVATQNYLVSITWRLKSKLYFNLLYEWSNDLFLTDDSRKWFGSSLSYKLKKKNQFMLFVGERRGGPSCNAGICFERLDFSGVEIRWNTRF